MDRILVLLAGQNYAQVDAALYSAKAGAALPARISYGLSLQEEPDAAAHAAMHALGSVQFLCPGGTSWTDVEMLWQGEGYVLIGSPAMTFTKNWDMQLLRILRQCRRDSLFSAVLTGYLPRRQDPVDAVCPVAAEGFDSQGRLCFHRGTPLRYASVPQRSAFIHQDFCFAPSAFFREMLREEGPLFLAAFRRKWDVYTLHRPLIHLAGDVPLLPCEVPPHLADSQAPGVSRFEMRFGMRLAERKLTAMARQGVFTADLTFPVHIPWTIRAQEALRDVMIRKGKASPLCVTAYVTLPQPGANLPEQYLCWFSYLSRLKNLSLLCYGDGDSARKIMPMHPNVLEYKRRHGLPVDREIPPDEGLNFLKLSKPFILARSREKFLNHSHYVWMDFGCLRYPAYERSVIDWSQVCREKIVLATVDGVPDGSMLVVPDSMLLTLCREIAALCAAEMNTRGHLPQETELWLMLIREHPDWFETIDMPGPRELITLTMMNREEEAHVYS